MEFKDKISIIIPIYNIEKYLRECLDSVINQTYKNLEIILVNDGSTDNSKEICEQYREKDSRIILINKENGGQSSARNVGIKKTTGNYLFFIDGDDVIGKKTIEYLHSMIKNNKADIAICGFEKFIDNYSTDSDFKQTNSIYDNKSYFEELLKINKSTYFWGTLFDIKFRNFIEFPEGKFYEDLAIFYKIIDKANKIVYNKNPLYKYRQVQNSTTHTYSTKKINDYVEFGIQMSEFIKNKYKDLSSKCEMYNFYIYVSAYLMSMSVDIKQARKYIEEIKKIRKNVKINGVSFPIKCKLILFKYCIPLGKLMLKLKNL